MYDLFPDQYYEDIAHIKVENPEEFKKIVEELELIMLQMNCLRNCFGEVIDNNRSQNDQLENKKKSILDRRMKAILPDENMKVEDLIKLLFYNKHPENVTDFFICTNGMVALFDQKLFKILKSQYNALKSDQRSTTDKTKREYISRNLAKIESCNITVQYTHKNGRIERRVLPFLTVYTHLKWTLSSALLYRGYEQKTVDIIVSDWERLRGILISKFPSNISVLYTYLQQIYNNAGTEDAIKLSQKITYTNIIKCIQSGNIAGLFIGSMNHLEKDSVGNPELYLREFARGITMILDILNNLGVSTNISPQTQEYVRTFHSDLDFRPIRFIIKQAIQMYILSSQKISLQ